MRFLHNIWLIALSLTARPLSHVFPKDKGLVAFLPRDGHHFTDNAIHFYEGLRLDGKLPPRAYLLVYGSEAVSVAWRKKGRPAFNYRPGSLRAALRYLRTSAVVTDNWQWTGDGRISFFAGAKKVQLWHGVPFKKVELLNLEGIRQPKGLKGLLDRFLFWLKGRYPHYDLMLVTSRFTKGLFKKAFRASTYVTSSYPRNDFFFREDRHLVDVDRDIKTLEIIRHAKFNGKKVVVYAPTFRDFGGNAFSDGALDLSRIARFAEEKGFLFVLKLHPYVEEHLSLEVGPSVVLYESQSDPSPLLIETDLLVADYSSIYFDYLHLDRPIVLFPYDHERYVSRDRQMTLPYEEIAAGPVVLNQEDLFRAIAQGLAALLPEHQILRQQILTRFFGEGRPLSESPPWLALLGGSRS